MTAPRRLSRPEFVALLAMLFATIAFSIDAMLPALPEIAGELTPDAPNLAQLVVTSFVLGMGIGTLFSGPLADALGRRAVILGGATIYITGAVIAWVSGSLELLLIGRFIQGLGAAGPRIAAMAIIRDLYEGRRMAQLTSFVMMVFSLFPAAAPAIGAGIIAISSWRGIFGVFVLFSLVSVIWFAIRQPETLHPEKRRPFRPQALKAGFIEVMSNTMVRLCLLTLCLTFGALFSVIVTAQPIFDVTFGQNHSFHWWFMLAAVIGAMGNLLNARIVMHFGMRPVARIAFWVQALAALLMILISFFEPWDTTWAFYLFVAWTALSFTVLGFTIGNLNAIAMAPLGHLAGMAASILGSMSSVGAVFIAIPVGLAFDGTPLPVACGVFVCAALALIVTNSLQDPEPTVVTEQTA